MRLVVDNTWKSLEAELSLADARSYTGQVRGGYSVIFLQAADQPAAEDASNGFLVKPDQDFGLTADSSLSTWVTSDGGETSVVIQDG